MAPHSRHGDPTVHHAGPHLRRHRPVGVSVLTLSLYPDRRTGNKAGRGAFGLGPSRRAPWRRRSRQSTAFTRLPPTVLPRPRPVRPLPPQPSYDLRISSRIALQAAASLSVAIYLMLRMLAQSWRAVGAPTMGSDARRAGRRPGRDPEGMPKMTSEGGKCAQSVLSQRLGTGSRGPRGRPEQRVSEKSQGWEQPAVGLECAECKPTLSSV